MHCQEHVKDLEKQLAQARYAMQHSREERSAGVELNSAHFLARKSREGRLWRLGCGNPHGARVRYLSSLG